MTDETLIADLIRAGVSPELVGRVANAIALSGTSTGAVRQYERDRKQQYRDNLRKQQQKPEANDAGVSAVEGGQPSADVSRTVPDNRCDLSSFLSSCECQQPEKKKEEVVARARGSRIVPDWQPSADDYQFAIDHGFSDLSITALRDEFVDYWVGVPGQRGLKRDWSATWRNRVRDKQPGMKGKSHGRQQRSSPSSVADDLIARAESFERENDLGHTNEPVVGTQGRKNTNR